MDLPAGYEGAAVRQVRGGQGRARDDVSLQHTVTSRAVFADELPIYGVAHSIGACAHARDCC